MKFLAALAIFVAVSQAYELNTRILLKRLPLQDEHPTVPIDRNLHQRPTTLRRRTTQRLRPSHRLRHHHHARRQSLRRHHTHLSGPQVTQFRHQLHRRMQQTSPSSSGVYSSQIYTPASLQTIVSSTMTSPVASSANIVVINQPIPIGTSGFNSGTINEMSTWRTGPYPPTNGYLTGAMTAYEIDPMLNLLKRIKDLYLSYYELLPERANPFAFQKNSPPNVAVLAFYKKVKTFSDSFASSRDELQNSMLFSISRLLTFKTGQDRMLKFFDMYSSWAILLQRAAPFEEYEPKIPKFYVRMADLGRDYSRIASRLMGETSEYQRVYEYFATEVAILAKVSSPDALTDAVEKFNYYLKFIVRLQEIRGDIFQAIDRIRLKLLELKDQMKRLAALNADLTDLVAYKEAKQIQDLKASEAYIARLKGLPGSAAVSQALVAAVAVLLVGMGN